MPEITWAKQGSPLSAEARKTIVVLKQYFDRVRDDTAELRLSSVERVAHSLGIGTATVRRVMAAFNKDPTESEKEVPPRGRPPRVIGDSLQALTRAFVREANKEGRHLTLETVCEALNQADPDQCFSLRTLGRTLDRWGFTFGKGVRTQRLKEKEHVIAARRRYLRSKRANRNGYGTHRPEVYLDESYVNQNHSNDFTWYWDEDGPWVQKPTGKGERLIIVNAITRNGWIPGARLVFKSNKKSGDYHGQMNHEIFSKWFTEMLCPNIPEHALIIMDNAAYHNGLAPQSAPTSTCKKDVIRQWLGNAGVTLAEDCLKAEMVEVLNKMAPPPTYAIDVVAEEHGHKVLRTPPYHPELQPIETCWGVVKNQVAETSDFTMATLIKQLDQAFQSVTAKTCGALIEKIRGVEDSFWQEDQQMDAE